MNKEITEKELIEKLVEKRRAFYDKKIELSQALKDIIAERLRQIGKGYTEAYDDQFAPFNLSNAGVGYALQHVHPEIAQKIWPLGERSLMPQTVRESLVRAATLIIAEIEKIDRKALKDELAQRIS